MIAYIQEDGSVAFCSLASSVPTGAQYIEPTELPQDPWHEAFEIVGDAVVSNVPKLKEWLHGRRRAKRTESLAPLDEEERYVTTSETRRAEIATEKLAELDANSVIQDSIDACADEAELRDLYEVAGL